MVQAGQGGRRVQANQLAAMDLLMAVGVEQHEIEQPFAAAIDLADDVVVVPPRRPLDLLAAVRAEPPLPFPAREEVGTIFEEVGHSDVGTTLEVRPPRRIVRVRLALDLDLDLDMTLEADVAGIEQPGHPSFSTDAGLTLECPRPPEVRPEVFTPDPPGPLVGVPAACLAP